MNEHIKNEHFKNYLLFSEKELEHIASCARCAEKLAEAVENDISCAPKGFFENAESKIKSKKQDFTYYCIRVGLAAAAAVVLIMSNVFSLSRLNLDKAEKLRVNIGKIWDNLEFGGLVNEKTEK